MGGGNFSDLDKLPESDALWRPKPTIGPVPKRVENYLWTPVTLPETPNYARNPLIKELGSRIHQNIMEDYKSIRIENDPWRAKYSWSNHPYFGVGHKVRLAFPGLGIATVAFGIYLGLEYLNVFKKNGSNSDHH